jgi:hypothetical protein
MPQTNARFDVTIETESSRKKDAFFNVEEGANVH